MCGICGIYSTSLSEQEKDYFAKTLMLNVFRGRDSTGIVKIKGKKTSVMKAAIPSPAFLMAPKGMGFIKDAGATGFIGHTRAATRGLVRVENSHPFNFENVVGVHNGTINAEFEHSKEYETDSEAVYRNINDIGLEETLKMLSTKSPAFVLTYVDKAEGTLNFVRNDKRPLWFTFLNSARNTLVWSSEKETLDFAIHVSAVNWTNKGWKDEKDSSDYFYIHPYDHMMIPLGASPTPGNVRIRHLDITEKTVTVVQQHHNSRYGGQWEKGPDGSYHPEEETRELWRKHFLEHGVEGQGSTTTIGSQKGGNGGPYQNFREKHGESIASLPWMRPTANSNAVTKTTPKTESEGAPAGKGREVTPGYGTKPTSRPELEFQIKKGCMCCGTVFVPGLDEDAISKIHWWSREVFACDDCYQVSDGDWVRCTIDDDWTPEEKAS
jgi:hypothetical protein